MGEVIAFPERRRPSAPLGAGDSSPAPVTSLTPQIAGRRVVAGDARDARGTPRSPGAPEPLWRDVTGAVLREERLRHDLTLAQVAARAGMSIQYLSELERGRKEASSEMLAAACGSLGLGLAEFARRCASTLTSIAAPPSGPVLLAA